MVFAAPPLPKTGPDLSGIGGSLLPAGVRSKFIHGMEVGFALVGLQRIFYESERTDLSAECSMLRPGRYAA